jgi:hypothetical protein
LGLLKVLSGSSWTGSDVAWGRRSALRAVHDPQKISVDLAVAVAPNGAARGESPGNAEQDIQITAIR